MTSEVENTRPGSKTVLYSAIYPASLRFAKDWYTSVLEQQRGEFDVCISLDQVTPEEVENQIGAIPKARWLFAPPDATPARIRHCAIQELIGKYEEIVFVDSDDILERDRVGAAQEGLARCDVYACALKLVDLAGNDLHSIFGPTGDESAEGLLPSRNIVGLSNSAFRSRVLRQCLPIPESCVFVDWFLATLAWRDGATFEFDPTPRMRYRQYPQNTMRMLPPFCPADVLAAAEHVRRHYRLVLAARDQVVSARDRKLRDEQDRVDRFHEEICRNPARLSDYTDALNRLPGQKVWWWIVAHPALEKLWN